MIIFRLFFRRKPFQSAGHTPFMRVDPSGERLTTVAKTKVKTTKKAAPKKAPRKKTAVVKRITKSAAAKKKLAKKKIVSKKKPAAGKKSTARKKVPAKKKAAPRKKSVTKKKTAKPGATRKQTTRKKATTKKKVGIKARPTRKQPVRKKVTTKKKAGVKTQSAKKPTKKKTTARKVLTKKTSAVRARSTAAKPKSSVTERKPAQAAAPAKKTKDKNAIDRQSVVAKLLASRPAVPTVAPTVPKRGPVDLDNVKLPKGYRPKQSETYMNPKHLVYFRRKLQDWRNELIEESQETLEHLRTESRDVGDEAERASRESDNILELRTRDRYRKLLRKIDQALERIDDGSYGYCEETGEEIGIGRLEARPIATLTVDAQERREMFQRQYRDDR